MNISRVLTGLLSSHTSRSGQWLSARRFPFSALQFAPLSADAAAAAPARRTSGKVPKSKPEADPKSTPEADPPKLSPSPSPSAGSQEESSSVQRPVEIPFQIKVANQVHLIGSVGLPVKLQKLPNGSSAAVSILTREEAKGLHKLWIPVIFLGDLAQIAASYLKENDVIYVTGQLSADAPPHTIEDSTTNIQVLADSLSFVQNVYPGKMHHKIEEKVEPTSVAAGHHVCNQPMEDIVREPEAQGKIQDNRKKMNSVEDTWNDLVSNMHNWRDCRTDKLNGSVKPRYPDFKHRITNASLWLDNAPSWVLPKLDKLVSNKKMPAARSSNHKENLWKSLADNPNDWWDDRLTKRNKAGPDFKHKETREGLWLNDAPQWVWEKLPSAKKQKNAQTFSSSTTLLS